MTTLGIIVARSGSKSIPGKNMALFRGQPLIYWTIKSAKAAKRLTRLIVSTDSQRIATYCQEQGVEVPFMRPGYLATDDARTIDVIRDVIERIPNFDAVCILQPTNPLRSSRDIDAAIDLMERTSCASVISGTDVGEHHPARMHKTDGEGRVEKTTYAEAYDGQPRQYLEKLRLRDGSIYLAKTGLIQSGVLMGGECREYSIPAERAWSVNEPLDLKVCEALWPATT